MARKATEAELAIMRQHMGRIAACDASWIAHYRTQIRMVEMGHVIGSDQHTIHKALADLLQLVLSVKEREE